MAISAQMVTAEKCIRIRERILIEGTLKVPAELADMVSVLDMTGLAEVNSLECQDGGLRITGTARYSVVYVDKMGEIMAFDAECTVDELVKQEVCLGMNAIAELIVGEVSFRMLDSRSVSVRSNIELMASTHGEQSYELAESVEEEGAQLLRREIELPQLICAKSMNAYIKSELKLAQGMPAVQKVLLCRGYARVESAITELERIIVEGTLHVHIVYLCEDKSLGMQCYRHSIPFSEVIHESDCSSDATAICRARLIRLGVEVSEDSQTLEVGAVIALNCRCMVSNKVNIISDVYACAKNCVPQTVNVNCSRTSIYEPGKRLVTMPLVLPSTCPEVAKVLYVGATFNVLNSVYERDRVYITGMASVNMCYDTKDVGVKNFSAQLPFETDISMGGLAQGSEIEVWADCESVVSEGTGREVELKANVEFHAEEVVSKEVVAISDAQFYPAEDEGSGIVVYCADGTQTLWEIAKRFAARVDTIEQLNDTGTDLPEKGNKLILIKS